MKLSRLVAFLIAAMLSFGAFAQVDVVQSPTPRFGEYLYDTDDWGWTHGAIAGPIGSATLDIYAFDVDQSAGEVDNIYVYDNSVLTLVGSLTGSTDVNSNTIFNLGSNFFDDINSGLSVWMDIDATNTNFWGVQLNSSTLTVTPIPEPEIYAMMAAGLGLMGFVARRRKQRDAAFG